MAMDTRSKEQAMAAIGTTQADLDRMVATLEEVFLRAGVGPEALQDLPLVRDFIRERIRNGVQVLAGQYDFIRKVAI
jgi:hypothetical protein